jgi:gamma-glutamyltranspeptidase/glutathione hydrolase
MFKKNYFLKKNVINASIYLSLSLSLLAAGNLELTPAEKDLSIRSVEAKHGVVASAHPIASKVGIEILKKGGNAVDAAVGVAFTLGLVEPNASGPGGGGFMLANMDGKQKMYTYYQKAPKKLTAKDWDKIKEDKSYMNSGSGAMVPGMVAGMLEAHKNYGTMSLKEILKPIIKLAEDGFEISPHLAGIMADSYEKLSWDEDTAKLFLNEGLPYSEGELFKNPDYAKTLKLISKKGRDGFYKGKTAKALMKENPWITAEDLEGYEAHVSEPISTDYRGHKIVTAAPESAAVAVLEALNIMENYDVAGMGPDSPELHHLWAEAMNISQTDRYHYVGDPYFSEVPVETLASQEYADLRAKTISMEKAQGKIKPGEIFKNLKNGQVEYESPSTTHVSIVDKNGNAVSMTNTVGNYFGYGSVAPDTGFSLNSHFTNFSSETSFPINKYEPGKRPRSTMSPSMVFDKDGNLELVIGTPGGTRITSIVPLVISNVLDHKMEIQDAINKGRIHKVNGKLDIEGNVSEEIVDYLKKKGHKIVVKGSNDAYFGGVHAIYVDKEEHDLDGGADPRRDGKALGY